MKKNIPIEDVSVDETDKTSQESIESLNDQLLACEQNLAAEKEKVLRAQADYQNMLRRSQEDRLKFAQLANFDLISSLLQPLDHLDLAANQLNDPGLNMVVQQFQKTLAEFGVLEIPVLNKALDVETMEAVESKEQTEKSAQQLKVVEVRQKGYLLNGKVIRHAKVVIG